MFTGDRSGDFLFAAMHRTGFASQATSTSRDDGLTLTDIRVTAPVRCAPPANDPTPRSGARAARILARELELLRPRVVVVLGAFGWQALLSTLGEQGWVVPRPRPAFAHGPEVELCSGPGGALVLLGCFHVSQQNTFTGRLTPVMLDDVLVRARTLVGPPGYRRDMEISFVAGFGPITRDEDAARAFWGDGLGITLEEPAPGYLTNDDLDGVKAFALWPLAQAAESTFGVRAVAGGRAGPAGVGRVRRGHGRARSPTPSPS